MSINVATSMNARLVAYLAANPGQHAPSDIARALDSTSHQVARALLYLAKAGRITRHRSPTIHNGPGSSTYSA